jgi:two-component system, sensor histidine kinase
MTVLIVDDDQDQRELRSLVLTRSGFTTFQASDKQTACQLAAEHHPAAALVDLKIPTVNDGFELIRELKALDSSIKVVVLTGAVPSSFQNRPEAKLMDELLTKPTNTAVLLNALRIRS